MGVETIASSGSFKPASLWMVAPGGSARCVADEIRAPNGPAVTDDARTLIVAETSDSVLSAFTIADDGSLGPRCIWAPCEGGLPDGIALDPQGDVWMACLNGHAVWRARARARHRRAHAAATQRLCLRGRRPSAQCAVSRHRIRS